ncbi:MAG TPA: efflux transporter outer membrane subunit [Steroidobacteraceae bacterium]|nr:efflux transporter outer membrane subunit [Steroidobacteraceae bacterium]
MIYARGFVLGLAAAFIAGCAVGPNYKRPVVEVPPKFKEAGDWKPAEPKDTAIPTTWWDSFNDPTLNELENQVEVSNQNLRVSEAQYRQARAQVGSARAAYFPTFDVKGAETRGENALQSGASSAATGTSGSTGKIQTTYSATAEANWEIDLWGSLRRSTESARANAQASAADLAGVRLSMQSELANDYFNLRVVDAQQQLLERTVSAYEETVRLTQNRYNAGVAMRSDVVQAQAQLKSAQAQLIDIAVQRAQFEHAIAVLVGKPPAAFTLTATDKIATLPETPQTVPSSLLEQRPDIAGAERRVASANAQIGVARAAFFPQLTLSGSGGYRSSSTANLFSLPNRFWSLGPGLAETLFNGGARIAANERAVAAYDQSVAQYRQTVLGGFQEVEDNLAELRVLGEEAQVESEAVELARESVRLVTNQYKAGTVAYLNVVNAQTTLYADERTLLTLQGRRFTAYINLVKALGGGWNSSQPVIDSSAR